MKKLLTGLIFLISVSSFGATLVCTPEPYTMDNAGVGITDKLIAGCEDFDSGERFVVEIKSHGISARLAAFQGFSLVCPFREGEALKGKYYGAKLEAEAMLGLKGGLFYAKDKACILGGAQMMGVGAAATLGTLEIR